MEDFLIHQVFTATDDVSDLIAQHNVLMRANTPEESCHVMTADSLFETGAQVFIITHRNEGALGVAALKAVDPKHVELKSMHTKSEARGRGFGAALLSWLIDEARRQGFERISLETGSDPLFIPARALYARHGFGASAPFGDYKEDPLSVYMTLKL